GERAMAGNTQALDQMPVSQLRGVGPQLMDKLSRLGIHSVQDMLFHLPLRYVDRTRITPIGGLQPFGDVLVEGEVKLCDIALGRRRSLVCRIQDTTGTLSLRFFHFSAAQKNALQPGTRVRCYGEVRPGGSGLEIYHPEYQILDSAHPPPLEENLTPVYPAAEGITQQRLRTLAGQALALLDQGNLPELLPSDLAARLTRIPLASALRFLHQPPRTANLEQLARGLHPAQQRLAFEELLAHHLSLLKLRQTIRRASAQPIAPREDLENHFLAHLPFALTSAQRRVLGDIYRDLGQPHPMLRLVQGDVGSGKTLVAALAALACAASGLQTAVMAPTEILAE